MQCVWRKKFTCCARIYIYITYIYQECPTRGMTPQFACRFVRFVSDKRTQHFTTAPHSINNSINTWVQFAICNAPANKNKHFIPKSEQHSERYARRTVCQLAGRIWVWNVRCAMTVSKFLAAALVGTHYIRIFCVSFRHPVWSILLYYPNRVYVNTSNIVAPLWCRANAAYPAYSANCFINIVIVWLS